MFSFHCITGFQTGYSGIGENKYTKQELLQAHYTQFNLKNTHCLFYVLGLSVTIFKAHSTTRKVQSTTLHQATSLMQFY